MTPEPVASEFLSLLRATREQLTYFKELGVESLETTQPAALSEQANAKVSKQPSGEAVRGNAARTAIAAERPIADRTAPPRERLRNANSLQSDSLFGDLGPAAITIRRSYETFEQIWSDIGDCTRCPLHQARTNIVHTEGNRKARLMFVGEAPGADEDEQARPFVGRAGQLLTKIIESIGFKREEVLIGNVNRCRPPGNRPPTQEEASMCKPFLLREIAAVQPEVIVVLGNTAMRNLLDIKQGITKVRGQFQDYHGVKVMPTFHPAYLLRDPSKKQETWEDLKKVRDYLATTSMRED
jgi:DNA polymerase